MKNFLSWMLILILITGCGQRQEKNKEAEKGVVHLSEASQKLIGLEIVKVEKSPLSESLNLTGEIAQESENVTHVTAPEPGTLTSYAKGLGEMVDKGAPVATIMTRTGRTVEITAPMHGLILAQYLKPGDSLDNLTSIISIADIDFLKASFDVYEKDLAAVEVGQKLQIRSIAFPQKYFPGEIVFVSPSVDEKSRTIKIRANIKNEDHLLKFGMQVTGELLHPVTEPVTNVPEEAVQQIDQKYVVFIPNAVEKNEFLIHPVQTGRVIGGRTEILSGLKDVQSVVGKGSYYLKAELSKGEMEEGDND